MFPKALNVLYVQFYMRQFDYTQYDKAHQDNAIRYSMKKGRKGDTAMPQHYTGHSITNNSESYMCACFLVNLNECRYLPMAL